MESGTPVPECDLRRRADAAEILDGPLQPDARLAGNLNDLARINRWTGGSSLLHRSLDWLLGSAPRPFSFLDVGGGRGDGVAGVVQWAARRQRRCEAILLDRSAPILHLADAQGYAGVCLLQGDGCRLPLRDRSIDVVACSLVLHHFSQGQATTLLRELARVARLGVIVDDLLRSHLGYLGAKVLGSVFTRNPLTRHDGPLSVRRAYTAKEISALLADAGLERRRHLTIPGYRTIVACRLSPAER